MTRTAPAAHDMTDAERLVREVGLTAHLDDSDLERLALLMDIVRRDTQKELVEELELLDHADAVETLKANGIA